VKQAQQTHPISRRGRPCGSRRGGAGLTSSPPVAQGSSRHRCCHRRRR
jgi:hypothetical protein